MFYVMYQADGYKSCCYQAAPTNYKKVIAKLKQISLFTGWICLEQRTEGWWLVNFPQYGENEDIAIISIEEKDLKEIPVMYALINKQIKAKFGD